MLLYWLILQDCALQPQAAAVGPFGGDPFAEDPFASDPFTASEPFAAGASPFALAPTLAARTLPTVQDLDHLVSPLLIARLRPIQVCYPHGAAFSRFLDADLN